MLPTLFACLLIAASGRGQEACRLLSATVQTDLEAVPVRGSTELSAAESHGSARAAVAEHGASLWRTRGLRIAEQVRPCWLPRFFTDRTLARWLAHRSPERDLLVVDREDRERDHEFGKSYQTTLWVVEEPAAVRRGEVQLRRELAETQRFAVVLGGGTVGLWALLAFTASWFDRLTRGYMTGRLWGLAVLVGVTAPAVAFLL